MEKRSLFSRIFGNNNSTRNPEQATEVKILDDRKAEFTPYKGDTRNDADVRACVDAIARNGAKMHPRHIRNNDKGMENLKGSLYRILAKQPNELQNAYQFYYQVITNLELYNDSFVYIQRDSTSNKVTGLYPIDFSEGKLYEYQDKIWIKFKFGRSKERFVPNDSCIHLTRYVGEDGLFGGKVTPIIKILSMKHIMDEGMINAIKTTQNIRGIIKSTKAMLKPEDVKKMRDQFVDDFIKSSNKSGIGGLDATTEFTPVKIEPTTANENQIKIIDDKLLSYFGINEHIIQSKYSEDEWNAFYESVLEPIGLQMSLEFSNKLFTPTEKYFGNEIIFESNALQYASNSTKIQLLRFGTNIMTQNELREVFNLAPRDGGDVILIDQNHQVLDQEENPEAEADPEAEPENQEEGNNEE